MRIPLSAICFSLAGFNICSLCLIFVNLINMCLGVFRLGFQYILYLWLHWVFVVAHRLSLVAASRGCSSLTCTSFWLQGLLLLQSTGSRQTGSVVVAHKLSCSTECGLFPDQGSNLYPCTGRRMLNHCATKEVPLMLSWIKSPTSSFPTWMPIFFLPYCIG